ncbi:hypothetical protein [Pseudanabaena sp. FACHB-2040]|uniref:DUF6918 family protein n=1 Tax=Pseudanabaena sp. FACHB-2040 TaxID=2692859 RepID=UPI00168712EC|nr:hypothetical protein [Pseudanabaena sp. FACHB-2040]MBD0268605.1 hypothetical protein [Cyanobacteria bacterium Co-bin8]MBD2256951.1 hypothetical protein [Pseudanabaena sp. FACHB-2040]
MGLREKIQDKAIRENIAADFAKLMDEQVATKNGFSGMALKTAYNVVKGVDAGYIPGAIGRILPDAFAALDPMWNEGVQAGNPVEHLVQNRSRTADTLLSVTDARIEKTNNGIVRSSYSKFRKSVKGDIEAAVPGMAKIIDAHVRG